ncbi:unnamed protein product [Adineta ricciae]|uniref:Uncharacterized protein n=1 Tax=Adineta ricciae TaxID=249248 RepID=A0A815KT96_ADIRI|nr:unnamed protein product [Adineta ricciae]
MLYADQSSQTELGNNNELFLPRSAAASYLSDSPVQQGGDRLASMVSDALKVLIPNDPSQVEQPQRAKRIHWEDLGFHATDYNRKSKKHY